MVQIASQGSFNTRLRRGLGYPLEAAAVWVLYNFLSILPLDAASGIGGWAGRTFGPRLRVSDTARKNLKRVFPELSNNEVESLVVRMWDNLGRTACEHPHLAKFDPHLENSRVEVVGENHVDQLMDDGMPGLFCGGHLANWEIPSLIALKKGIIVGHVYRRANNPYFDRIVQNSRGALGGNMFAKGPEGAKDILRSLQNEGHLAMVVDQKMNDGVSVPFLGIDAMTAPAVAQLAYRYDCPVVPVRVERLEGARFRVTYFPPMEKPDTGDKQTNILALMTAINRQLGEWIREQPEQWLWVHNRWPDPE